MQREFKGYSQTELSNKIQGLSNTSAYPLFWATLLSGALLLAINPYLLSTPWIQAKLFVLLFLVAYSFSMEYYRVQLDQNTCEHNGQFFRAYNEVPTMLSVLIVAYVVTKEVLFFILMSLFLIFGTILLAKSTRRKMKTDRFRKVRLTKANIKTLRRKSRWTVLVEVFVFSWFCFPSIVILPTLIFCSWWCIC